MEVNLVDTPKGKVIGYWKTSTGTVHVYTDELLTLCSLDCSRLKGKPVKDTATASCRGCRQKALDWRWWSIYAEGLESPGWFDVYSNYLQSEEWQSRRILALERAEYWCQECRNAIATQVHHRTYARVGFELPDDLEALCAGCHKEKHWYKDFD